MISIRVVNDIQDGQTGKKFEFNCTYCDYEYISKTILKPKSVWNIVKDEYKEHNKNLEFFEAIKGMHKHYLNYEILHDKMIKDLKSGKKVNQPKEIESLKQYNIDINKADDMDKIKYALDNNKPVKREEHEEVVNGNEEQNGISILNKQFPVPRKLITRNTVKCIDCSQVLQQPTDELVSTKFIAKFSSSDYLPIINISPLINKSWPSKWENMRYTLLVTIVNQINSPISVTLSSPSTIPTNKGSIETTIPISEISIGGYNEKDHPIRSIPTVYLTKETKVSRAELVMRTGKLGTQSTELIESLIEKNDNWGCLPIELSINCNDNIDNIEVKIPIYVTVKSRLPESIKSLKLSKPALSFGFWTVIDLNGKET